MDLHRQLLAGEQIFDQQFGRRRRRGVWNHTSPIGWRRRARDRRSRATDRAGPTAFRRVWWQARWRSSVSVLRSVRRQTRQRADRAARSLPRAVAAKRIVRVAAARAKAPVDAYSPVPPARARADRRLALPVAGCAGRSGDEGRPALCRARRRHALFAAPSTGSTSGDYKAGGRAVRRGRAPASLFDLGAPRAADERVQLLSGRTTTPSRSSRRSASCRSIRATATRPMPITSSRSAITSRSATSRATRRSPSRRWMRWASWSAAIPIRKYAADARLKIDLVRDHLAGKEMEIGRFYETRGQWLAGDAALPQGGRRISDDDARARGADAADRDLSRARRARAKRRRPRRCSAPIIPARDWYKRAYKLMQRASPGRRSTPTGAGRSMTDPRSARSDAQPGQSPVQRDACGHADRRRRAPTGRPSPTLAAAPAAGAAAEQSDDRTAGRPLKGTRRNADRARHS